MKRVQFRLRVTLLAILLVVASLSTWMGANIQDVLIANASSLSATQVTAYQSDEFEISQSEKLKLELLKDQPQMEEVASYDFDYSLPRYTVDGFEKDEDGKKLEKHIQNGDVETDTQSGNGVTNGDYFTSNILSVVNVGDIAVMETGFGGITGHTAIVYDVTSTSITTIEAFPDGGVQFRELDSYRFYNDKTTLFSVNATQTQKNDAAWWSRMQIGRGYWAYSPTSVALDKSYGIMCSNLTWGAYYYAGINLTGEPINDITIVTPRSIRDRGVDRNYLLRKEVYYKGYEIVNQKSGKAMDVPDGKASDGKDLWQYTRNNTDAQVFIEVTSSQSYSSQSLYDTRYFPLINANYYMHIERPFWPWEDTNANDRFIEIVNDFLDFNDDTSIFWWSNNQFKTKLSGYSKAIHVRGASTADKANLVTWDAGNDSQSKWNKNYVRNVSIKWY